MTEPYRVAVTLEQCWHRVPGGVARAALESARALLAHPEVAQIGVSARHRHPAPAAFDPPIEVRPLPLPRPVLYESWHRARWPVVQRATGPVDVIHATGMAVPPHSAPLVVTVHDLAFLYEPAHSTPRGLRFFHRSIELARRDADLVIAPSRATIDDCLVYGFDPDKLRLVPWGIDPISATDEEVASVRGRFGLSRPYVLWTGTIEPRKNLPTLLEAFGRLGRAGVDLVLAGPAGWNEDLEPLVAPVRERVRTLGFLGPRELRALYAGADVFCFPSTREGFGLPVLEAMAQGTPVVTSSLTATAEVAGDAALLVDPLDAEALADALAAVLDDPTLASRLGAEGRARAADQTWARTAERLAAVYLEVAR